MDRDEYRPGTLLFSQVMVLGSMRQWRGTAWGMLTRLFCHG
jgi:hypothetical protein